MEEERANGSSYRIGQSRIDELEKTVEEQREQIAKLSGGKKSKVNDPASRLVRFVDVTLNAGPALFILLVGALAAVIIARVSHLNDIKENCSQQHCRVGVPEMVGEVCMCTIEPRFLSKDARQ